MFSHNQFALLTCDQMRCAEEIACAQGDFTLFDLMQKAGAGVAKVIMEKRKPCRVVVLCGPGNNGGDGFVIARLLSEAGWSVVVGAVLPNKLPVEAEQAAAAWKGNVLHLDGSLFDEADLVVDALFGIGLQRDLEDDLAKLVTDLNQRKLPVVSVDIPSGIDGDTGQVRGCAVRATTTVTFFRKKPGHVLLPGLEYSGEVVVADIGISGLVFESAAMGGGATIVTNIFENSPDLWISLFPFPKTEGHKYTRGHALVYGGAMMTGAARLAARAAQRIGAGLVTLAAPAEAVGLYSVALESVIVRVADTVEVWRELVRDPKKDVFLIGPGAGISSTVRSFILEALATKKPCVLDADALTVFADEPKVLFDALHSACVLTPHEGEFRRLFVQIEGQADKLARVRQAAALAGCVVLLKGADTVIAAPEGKAIINHNAPPWLATGGAGDVLAGMILGLLAAGMPVFEAAGAAAWVHGQISTAFGPGLIAEDLVEGIPNQLKGLSALT